MRFAHDSFHRARLSTWKWCWRDRRRFLRLSSVHRCRSYLDRQFRSRDSLLVDCRRSPFSVSSVVRSDVSFLFRFSSLCSFAFLRILWSGPDNSCCSHLPTAHRKRNKVFFVVATILLTYRVFLVVVSFPFEQILNLFASSSFIDDGFDLIFFLRFFAARTWSAGTFLRCSFDHNQFSVRFYLQSKQSKWKGQRRTNRPMESTRIERGERKRSSSQVNKRTENVSMSELKLSFDQFKANGQRSSTSLNNENKDESNLTKAWQSSLFSSSSSIQLRQKRNFRIKLSSTLINLYVNWNILLVLDSKHQQNIFNNTSQFSSKTPINGNVSWTNRKWWRSISILVILRSIPECFVLHFSPCFTSSLVLEWNDTDETTWR